MLEARLRSSRPAGTSTRSTSRERARRQGVAKALLAACGRAAARAGCDPSSRSACSCTNTLAESVWRRLGFEPVELVMAQSLDALDVRLGDVPAGPSRASTHVADRRSRVGRARDRPLRAPARRGRGRATRRTAGSGSPTRCSTPTATPSRGSRRDLSDRLGAVVVALALEHGAVVRFRLYERGRMVDEYLSVPDVLRRARPRRRARARGEPDARRPPDRRRPRRGSPGRADGRRRRPTCRQPRSSTREIAGVMGLEVDP